VRPPADHDPCEVGRRGCGADVDLLDHAKAAAFDRVERGLRLTRGSRRIHLSLTFRAGK
jgi:hypothetical protein